jgi:putative flippase GtrA
VFVFVGARKQNRKQATIFIGSSIIGLGLNQICMWVFVEIAGMYYMLAKIFATGIVTIWNYIMKRKAVNGTI